MQVEPLNAVDDQQNRVLAVVVAFNSPEAIARCLRSLGAQTQVVAGVLVVDNSDQESVNLGRLDDDIIDRTTVLSVGDNLGPAGGFALGLAWFMENGQYSHAWLMDDDNYPEPDTCELLLRRTQSLRPGSAVFPAVLNENSGELINFPSWCGVLIDRLAVTLAGFPMAELFWWAEDTEYLQHRLPRKGVVVQRVDEAVVRDDRVRRVGGRPPWKYYYEVRNMIWFRIWEQKGSEIHKLPRTLVRMFGSALLSKDRGRKLRMYVRGVAHGLGGRLGREVAPPAPGNSTAHSHDA